MNKEPKEDFTILAGLLKIVPDIKNKGEVDITYEKLGELLKEINPNEPLPTMSNTAAADVNMANEESKDLSVD